MKVKQAIDEKLETLIDNQLSVLINEGKITPSGKKEILFTDHIRTLFMSNTGWSRPDQQIKKLAKDFGEQMKLQYNNAFANQIVMGMKEQGLLKDEVVQILLDGPTT